MSRNRGRRSFTVETKLRGRQVPAALPIRAPLLAEAAPVPARTLLSDALFAPREPAEPAARRILPSLLPEPEPEAAPQAEPPAQEPPLPRVRRVQPKPRRAAAPAEPFAVRPAPPVLAPVLAPIPAPAAPVPPVPRRAETPAPPRRPDDALPRGQRWKRRLPRVCW